jgi:peptide deformylase
MKLPLAYYGDAVLRKKAAPLEKITDEIRELVQNMIETMHAHNGIGLAAPQVNHSVALFITYAPHEQPDGSMTYGPIKVFINPKLSQPSDEEWSHSEACLSLPGLSGDVFRPKKISVTYLTLEGETITEDFAGWPARVIMHENDHLNGVLFVDRLEVNERKKTTPLLAALKKKLSKKEERDKLNATMPKEPEM